MNHEHAPNPEHPLEKSFTETVKALVDSQPISEDGVQEVICNLESLQLTEEEKSAVGDSRYARVNIVHYLYDELEDDGEIYAIEPDFTVEFVEPNEDNTMTIVRQFKKYEGESLSFSSGIVEYEGKRVAPTRLTELVNELENPDRDDSVLPELGEIIEQRQQAEITVADDAERFETAINLLRKFIA